MAEIQPGPVTAAQFPRGARRAVADWLLGHPQAGNVDPWEDARGILEAVLPLIERDVQRKMARHVLALDSLDREKTRNKPPWTDMRTSLRKLSRGEELPSEQAVREQLSEVARGR